MYCNNKENHNLLIPLSCICFDGHFTLPKLNDIYKKYKDKDLDIFAISVDNNPEKLKKFVEKNKIQYNVLLDKDTKIAMLYGVMGVPAHFVVDKNGIGYFYGPDIGTAMSMVDWLLQNN